MIERVTPEQVLARCRETLGLAHRADDAIDEVLLAALLRHSAGIHCPCSRATLRTSVFESTQALSPQLGGLANRLDDTIEALIIGGDLLELNDVITDDSSVRQTWVFAAPPSFVVRPSGAAFVFGVVPDQDMFLPSSMNSRLHHEGFTRSIAPRPEEDLAQELRNHGLQQLSVAAWLKSPRRESAADMLNRFEQRVSGGSPTAAIPSLQILDPTQPVTYYPRRWVTPSNQTGTYVARRPLEFGAPMWCLVRVKDGAPVRLLDLPLPRTRWRGCDTAWHLQMAIDHCRGQPQRYRRQPDSHGVRFDFFSPLPQWSQRRLMTFGTPIPRDGSLLGYVLPPAEARTEETFLQDTLWLTPTEDSE